MDINKLVSEAEHGMKGNLVEDAITDDAREFWDAIKKRITEDDVKMKPYVLCRILEDNFNIKLSETAMKNYLKKFDNGK